MQGSRKHTQHPWFWRRAEAVDPGREVTAKSREFFFEGQTSSSREQMPLILLYLSSDPRGPQPTSVIKRRPE